MGRKSAIIKFNNVIIIVIIIIDVHSVNKFWNLAARIHW